MPIRALFIVFAVALLGPFAHAQQAGGHAHASSHGGQIQKIGKYEAELVVKGNELTLHVSDEKDAPVDASRFSAIAQILAKGNQQKSIELKPAGGNKLTGGGDFQVDDKLRATVTLSAAGAEVGKARYSLDVPKR